MSTQPLSGPGLGSKPQPEKPKPPHKFRSVHGCSSDTPYEDDEREFLMAMDRFKREKDKKFPTWRDALHVLKSLGYKK